MSLEHAATTAASMPLHSGLLWLVPFLPAFGALFNGLTGRRLKSTKIVDADVSKIDKTLDERDHPGLHRTGGHIGFMGHNDPVELRNIRLKVLK